MQLLASLGFNSPVDHIDFILGKADNTWSLHLRLSSRSVCIIHASCLLKAWYNNISTKKKI